MKVNLDWWISLGVLLNDVPLGINSQWYVMVILGLVGVAFAMNGYRYWAQSKLVLSINWSLSLVYFIAMMTTFAKTAPQLTWGFLLTQGLIFLAVVLPPLRQLFLNSRSRSSKEVLQ